MALTEGKTNLARRKRIGESKLFDLVTAFKYAKPDKQSERWVQIVNEVQAICEAELARTEFAK